MKLLVPSLLLSVFFVVPFIVMQWVNRRTFQEDFPLVLFTFMSVHALLFALVLIPALRRLKVGKSLGALKLGHGAGLLLGAFLICVYAGVVIDQLPCFLGVPTPRPISIPGHVGHSLA